ncbi:hypothetical protein HDU92_001536 [Lobulomyces angularis]|nr:hypothetical protein HDU92_001536 [Lobulomyces angularis]
MFARFFCGMSGYNNISIREYKQRADIFTMFSLVTSEKPERLGHRLPIVATLQNTKMRYGFSEGEPNETALDYIKNHEILKNTKLIAYGQSVGGAVAIDVVSKNENLFEALIIENILFLFFTSPSFERRDFYCYEDGFISTERDFDFTTCFEESVLTPVISFYFTCSFIYFKFSLKQERTQFTPRRPPSYYIEAVLTSLFLFIQFYYAILFIPLGIKSRLVQSTLNFIIAIIILISINIKYSTNVHQNYVQTIPLSFQQKKLSLNFIKYFWFLKMLNSILQIRTYTISGFKNLNKVIFHLMLLSLILETLSFIYLTFIIRFINNNSCLKLQKGTLLGGYLDLYKDSSKNVSFELPPCSSSSGRTVLSKFMDEDQGYYSDGDDLDGKPNKYQD